MAQPDLSSPPRTVVPSVRIMSPSTIGFTPSPGLTVSMWAHSNSGAAPATVPSICAIRLPTSPLTRSAALSNRHVAPACSVSRLSRIAQARSRRECESIRTRSSRRCLRRSRLTAAIGAPLYAASCKPLRNSRSETRIRAGVAAAALSFDQFDFDKLAAHLVPCEGRGAAELAVSDRQYHVSGVGIIRLIRVKGAGLAPVGVGEVGVVVGMRMVHNPKCQAAPVDFAQHRNLRARVHQVGGAGVARMGGGVAGMLLVLDIGNRTHFLGLRAADYEPAAFIRILALRLRPDCGEIVAPDADLVH